MSESSNSLVLCAGYVNWDIVLHIDALPEPDFSADIEGDHTSCGGSATNTAMALTSFNQSVALFGGIGDDTYGSRIKERLAELGVIPELAVGGLTTVIYALMTPDDDPHYLARYGGAVSNFSPQNISTETWEQASHIHVTSFSQEVSGSLAEYAKDAGKTVSFNPSQGYQEEEFPKVVHNSDIIFLNEREAEIFRDRYTFDEIVDNGTCIVVTQGEGGSGVYTPDEYISHSGYPVDSEALVDPIGAGDCFIAGFLSSWVDGVSMKEALAKGNAAGAYAVTQVGAPDELDMSEIQSRVDDD